MRRVATVFLAFALAATGCGSDENPVAAPTERPAAPGTSGPSAGLTSDLTLSGPPPDDGGRLCRANLIDDPMAGVSGLDTVEELVPYVDGLDSIAAQFRERFPPAVPPEFETDAGLLIAGAERLARAVRDLRDAIEAGSDRVDQLLDEAEAAYQDQTDDVLGVWVAPGRTRYRNYFLAWIASPCGPKPLEFDVPYATP
jgi:hypothetical protein